MSKFPNIDKKDLKILQALDENPRYTYIQIAKKTKLSKETVQYRIKQLEKKEIIQKYISSARIGTETLVHKLLIKNKSLSDENKNEFINFLNKQKAISWVGSCEGSWDFIITSITKKQELFAKTVKEIMNKFGSHFKKKTTLQSTAITILNEKYLHDKNKQARIYYNNFLEEEIKQDKITTTIMNHLAENARAPYTELAKLVNLTPEAIGKRFKKIKENTSFNLRINHSKLNLNYYHLFISMENFSKQNELIKFYIQHPNITFIMEHTGYYDLHLEIVINQKNAEKILDELRTKFGKHILNYELLKITKEHFIKITK